MMHVNMRHDSITLDIVLLCQVRRYIQMAYLYLVVVGQSHNLRYWLRGQAVSQQSFHVSTTGALTLMLVGLDFLMKRPFSDFTQLKATCP